MRANVHDFDLITPATLEEALTIIVERQHTPIAGGTELMVALAAGRLPRKPLVSIQLEELRFIRQEANGLSIGAAITFSNLREDPIIARDFPLLSAAASWTGSIANQNRGTIGGNIVNASPAADTSPALLVYEATLTLISAKGQRTLPYREFHMGYKKTALRGDELLFSIHIPNRYAGYKHCIRKVGTRNAQAISKVALALLAKIDGGTVRDVRVAAASLRETPSRLEATEQVLLDRPINAGTIAQARAALIGETRPIDDIRSTAAYRSAVAANLLEEFLRSF
jgi:CO/xanthine dehydrogenase FAD-binding subunit